MLLTKVVGEPVGTCFRPRVEDKGRVVGIQLTYLLTYSHLVQKRVGLQGLSRQGRQTLEKEKIQSN